MADATDPVELLRLADMATARPWQWESGMLMASADARPNRYVATPTYDGEIAVNDAAYLIAAANAAPGLCRRLRAAEGRVAALAVLLRESRPKLRAFGPEAYDPAALADLIARIDEALADAAAERSES